MSAQWLPIGHLNVNPAFVACFFVDEKDKRRTVLCMAGSDTSCHSVEVDLPEVRRLLEGGKP